VLRKLEDKGLISSRSDSRDRRAKIVQVTPKGIRVAEHAVIAVEKADAEFFSAAASAIVPALRTLADFEAG
jgi:DNA-binding MarR family transcriptional regulator